MTNDNLIDDVVAQRLEQAPPELAQHIQNSIEEGKDPFAEENIPEGLQHVLTHFLEYAKEVIINRAIPSMNDGLKPVQRIGLYILAHNKQASRGSFVKSPELIGQILPYHPHGDSSAYEAITRMTDVKGILSVPLVKGDGGFGTKFSTNKPAAMRYTSMGQTDYFNEIISTPAGVPYVKTEDEEHEYWGNMPVSFPLILANVSTGIAVGIATSIPSFNMKDIVALVEEYVTDGKFTTLPVPDFSTGGTIVQNNKEISRIAKTGKGTLKLRASAEITGNEIEIIDLPYGITHNKLQKELSSLKDEGYLTDVMDWYEESGMQKTASGKSVSKFKFVIKCRNKNTTEACLLELYSKTSLQSYFHSNIITIQNGVPRASGVYQLVRSWVQWRKRVVTKQAKHNLDAINDQLSKLEVFLKVVDNRELLTHLTEQVQSGNKQKAFERIQSEFNTTLDIATWVIDRKLSQFDSVSNKYKTKFEELSSQEKYWTNIVKNPEVYILEDMKRIKNTPSLYKERQTQVTSVDYNFVKREEEVLANEDAYFVVDGNFIKKLDSPSYAHSESAQVFKGKSSDVIVCIDDQGHILRIYGEEIPYNLQSDRGTYIPRYCGFEEDLFIMWSTLAQTDKKFLLMYTDGYVGHLDTTKYARENVNQRSRVQMVGIYPDTDKLLDIVPYEPNNYLVVKQETSRTSKIGVAKIGDIKVRASKARTKVMNNTDVTDWGIFTSNELDSQFFPTQDYLVTDQDKKMKPYDGDLPAHVG